ncbi:hypothetical protein ABW19_dt0207369 [Dactylella cylindrospora]|nr:hypothetical protein ABW19_dt0207369 [Dactylella cylindrospora]
MDCLGSSLNSAAPGKNPPTAKHMRSSIILTREESKVRTSCKYLLAPFGFRYYLCGDVFTLGAKVLLRLSWLAGSTGAPLSVFPSSLPTFGAFWKRKRSYPNVRGIHSQILIRNGSASIFLLFGGTS